MFVALLLLAANKGRACHDCLNPSLVDSFRHGHAEGTLKNPEVRQPLSYPKALPSHWVHPALTLDSPSCAATTGTCCKYPVLVLLLLLRSLKPNSPIVHQGVAAGAFEVDVSACAAAAAACTAAVTSEVWHSWPLLLILHITQPHATQRARLELSEVLE